MNNISINDSAVQNLVSLFISNGMTQDDATRTALLNIELKARMSEGAVKFVFRKKDGSLRTAIGTNKSTIVPNFYQFKGSARPEPVDTYRYFDLEKGAFRSFTKANLVSIAA